MLLVNFLFLTYFTCANNKHISTRQHSSPADLMETYECPDKSTYTDLTDDSNQKLINSYYACNIEYKNPQALYYSLLRVYNCIFSNIQSQYNGAIYIMNSPGSMSNLPKDPIEIIDTKFLKCTTGSIFIQSTGNDPLLYNITQCSFEQCKSTQDSSAICFQGFNAAIEKCTFIDNDVTQTQAGADIYLKYLSPNEATEGVKISIKNNQFVRSNNYQTKSSIIYYENTEGFVDFTDNQINIDESVNIKILDCKKDITDFSKLTIKSNSIFPYREDIILSDNAKQLPIGDDSFHEGPSYEFPVVKCPDQAEYDTFIEEKDEKQSFSGDKKVYGCEKTIKNQIETENCILGLFHCNFANFEDSAVFIKSTSGQANSKNKIYNCNFNSIKEGCIIIDTDGDRSFYDIVDCTFEKCKSESNKASTISFKASDGKIEKCTFRNNYALNGGDIEFNPSMVEATFNRLVITRNKFERNDPNYQRGVFVLFNYKQGSRLNLSYNDFSVSMDLSTSLFSCESKVESYQFWNFVENCLNPYRKDLIKGSNADNLPIDEFDYCDNINCPPIPDGYENPQLLHYSCGDIIDESGGFDIENSIAAIYYSTFNKIIDYEHGAIYINTKIDRSDLTEPTRIHYCDFTSCMSDKGASIYIESVETTRLYDIHCCTFKDMILDLSKNDLKGGAIYINAKHCNIRISECSFANNKGGSGGAIYYVSEWGTQLKSLLEDTKDYSLHVLDCVFDNNEASENGGAICISVKNGEVPKPIKIENCTFLNNRANESDTGYEDGGAIYYKLESTSTSSSSSLTSSEDFSFSITNCTFIGNYVSYSGGAIYIYILNIKPSKPIEITKCIFDKNRADNSEEDNLEPSNKRGTGSDIYYYFNSEAEVENDFCFRVIECNFSNSKSYEKGGSIQVTIDISKQPSKPTEIKKCSFIDCTSEAQDAIYFESTVLSALLHIDECEFKGLSSVYVNATACNIEKSHFVDVKHPIQYNCNSPSDKSDTHMLKINNCTFNQKEDITALIYLYSVNSPTFKFIYNDIVIDNANTKVFDVPNDFDQSAGKWLFESNWIEPPEGKYLKTDAAKDLPAECGTGFFCDIQSSIPAEVETSLASEEISTSQSEEPSSSIDNQSEEPSSSIDNLSEEPSFSEEPPSGDYYNGTNCERNQRCKINQDKDQLSSSYVDISSSNFNGLKNPENGAAIHLINFGITCDDETTFTGCISSEGAGGGIYIYIDKPFEYPVLIRNIIFTSCKAMYGGAVYAYCNQEEGEIQIIQSKFFSNEATKTKSQNGDQLYGGSAIYLSAKNANIANCTIKKNVGSGVKVYNDFKSSSKSLKSIESSSVLITNCLFDVNKESSSSLFYVRGKNKEVDVNVVDCTFTGKLKDGSYYIDGISLSDKKKEISRLHINSCKFESDSKNVVNLRPNNSLSLLADFDVNSQQFNYMVESTIAHKQVNYYSHNLKIASAVFFVVVACGTLSILVIMMINRKKSTENTDISAETVLA